MTESSSASAAPKDNWAAQDYINNAGFVPKLASVLIDDFLVPSLSDAILDIGCGDGDLTARIPCKSIVGVDSSASLLDVARGTHGLTVKLLDARDMRAQEVADELNGGQLFDKVVSNAALHWILNTRDREVQTPGLDGDAVRQRFFDEVFGVLKPGTGAVFAAEMGGLGNVAEIHTAFVAALVRHGMTPAQIDAAGASPWFFPHEDTVRAYLERAGFVVDKIERVYRSTHLPHGRDGLLQWIKLFGFSFVAAFEKFQKDSKVEKPVSADEFLQEVHDLLTSICFDPKDPTQAYAGYVRLRWRAIKP